jgi:hypothetical protein
MTKYLTTIPFSGFYESVHSMRIDDAINQHFDDHEGSGENKTPWHLDLNYSKAMNEYAKDYLDAFSKEIGIPLEYDDLESPKEYNFTTDRIFAYINEEDLIKLRDSLDTDDLEKMIADRFTSRDGFSSFYQNSLSSDGQPDYKTSWDKPVTEYDHNQIGTLLELKASNELSEDWELYAVESFYFDDLPPEASAYADYLSTSQRESCDNSESSEATNGKDFESLLEYDDWIKTKEKEVA